MKVDGQFAFKTDSKLYTAGGLRFQIDDSKEQQIAKLESERKKIEGNARCPEHVRKSRIEVIDSQIINLRKHIIRTSMILAISSSYPSGTSLEIFVISPSGTQENCHDGFSKHIAQTHPCIPHDAPELKVCDIKSAEDLECLVSQDEKTPEILARAESFVRQRVAEPGVFPCEGVVARFSLVGEWGTIGDIFAKVKNIATSCTDEHDKLIE